MEQTEHLRISWCINAAWTVLQVLTFKFMALVVFSLLGCLSMRTCSMKSSPGKLYKKRKDRDTFQYECYSQQSCFLLSKGHSICIKCIRPRKTVTYKKAGTLSCSAQIHGNLEVFKTENSFPSSPSPYISQYVNSHKCLASKHATSIYVNQWR